ncbi:GNAT family N-acetyltransferase [Brachyspira innocens]|uniref:GNAT family N-acetyltransferase n=1 Tax=Brachyspira innocens TaxID=13264 RepID=A0ABT8YW53_9SPIR|nr:GNAT family N-acetyltransferase [Brachyspira innocens]MDO6992781.1 GNAT family N-acetyltransferase [Brachyspira innocens]MDO7020137.1 GNAT family N-acetyltransferase [Brachyspira innocens]
MEHRGTVELENERLLLRKFRLDDAYDMYNNWANDDDVTKYLTWKTYKSIDDAKKTINEWTSKYDNDNFYQWGIVLKEEGNILIGSISVVYINDNTDTISVGYCISKNYWNKGITSEAFSILINFFFNDVRVNRIEAFHNVYNISSGKVMLKCGLKKEGVLREYLKDNTGISDAAVYSILRRDYIS